MKPITKCYTLKNAPEVIIPDYAAGSYKPEELQELDIVAHKTDKSKKDEKLSEVRSKLIDHIDGIDVSITALEDMRLCLHKEVSDKDAFKLALKVLKRVGAEAREIHRDLSL